MFLYSHIRKAPEHTMTRTPRQTDTIGRNAYAHLKQKWATWHGCSKRVHAFVFTALPPGHLTNAYGGDSELGMADTAGKRPGLHT